MSGNRNDLIISSTLRILGLLPQQQSLPTDITGEAIVNEEPTPLESEFTLSNTNNNNENSIPLQVDSSIPAENDVVNNIDYSSQLYTSSVLSNGFSFEELTQLDRMTCFKATPDSLRANFLQNIAWKGKENEVLSQSIIQFRQELIYDHRVAGDIIYHPHWEIFTGVKDQPALTDFEILKNFLALLINVLHYKNAVINFYDTSKRLDAILLNLNETHLSYIFFKLFIIRNKTTRKVEVWLEKLLNRILDRNLLTTIINRFGQNKIYTEKFTSFLTYREKLPLNYQGPLLASRNNDDFVIPLSDDSEPIFSPETLVAAAQCVAIESASKSFYEPQPKFISSDNLIELMASQGVALNKNTARSKERFVPYHPNYEAKRMNVEKRKAFVENFLQQNKRQALVAETNPHELQKSKDGFDLNFDDPALSQNTFQSAEQLYWNDTLWEMPRSDEQQSEPNTPSNKLTPGSMGFGES